MRMLSVFNQISMQTPTGFRLRLMAMLLLAAALEALAGLLLLRKKTWVKTLMAALSLGTAAAALILCFSFGVALDPFPKPQMNTEGDPRDTVEAFFAALEREDYAGAASLLGNGGDLASLERPADEDLQQLYEAMAAGRTWELRGESVIEGLGARQQISLRTLSLGELQRDLNAESEAYLRAITGQRARRDLADEEGAFLRPVAEEAWRRALRVSLEQSDACFQSVELELDLLYTAGGWRLMNTDELLRILSGGAGEVGTEPLDLESWMDRSLREATAELVYTRTIYTVPEDAAAGPAFDRGKYVYTSDPAVVQSIVDSAAALLDGQELCWNPSIQRMAGSQMICYCDETILVICWKEIVNDCCLSFCEVKIAHGSQLRRALAGGSYHYGPGPRIPETSFSTSVNAVASIDGDFYDYRNLGITVYQRQVYRNNPALIDSCFFTASGDMLFAHRGELMGEGEAEQFVKDNDVVFGLAFGPILVEDGEATHTASYPLGEVQFHYSRAAIGQLDSLHYLLMTCGFGDWYDNVPDINETAQYIQAKGVDKAYTLDGGQTAEICVNGHAYNHIDFDTERPMSDIIYFVTALPEEGPPNEG